MTNETQTLDYHHPEHSQYSLYFLSDDKTARDKKAIELSRKSDAEFIDEVDTIDGTEVYLLYRKNAPDSPITEFETDEEVLHWFDENFTDDEQQIVVLIIKIFDQILSGKEEHDNNFSVYKQMELEKVSKILNRVEWRQSVADVSAELLSHFILVHPLPNTNHRTAITLVNQYLETIDDDFVMPDTGEENEWYPWAADYIRDSKRILTLRRNFPKLEWANKLGYDTAERKEGVQIDLTTIDFNQPNYFEYYTDRHLSRSRAFIDTVLGRADATHLQQQIDDGKRAFIDRIRTE